MEIRQRLLVNKRKSVDHFMEVQYLSPVDIFTKILGQKIRPPKKGNSHFVGVFFTPTRIKSTTNHQTKTGCGCPKEICSNALVLCWLFSGLTNHHYDTRQVKTYNNTCES